MPLTPAGRDALLVSGYAGFTHIGALTAIDGTEVVGGSYARQVVVMGPGGSGIADNNDQETIPIPAGVVVVALAYYDALVAGNRLSLSPYGSMGQIISGAGTCALDDTITTNGHSLINGDRVFVAAIAGESLPPTLSATTLYHVIDSTTNTFKVSASAGGVAIDITAVGELAWFRTVPNTFNSAGNVVIPAGGATIDLNWL